MAAPSGVCEFCGAELDWKFLGHELWTSCPRGCDEYDMFASSGMELAGREQREIREAVMPELYPPFDL